MTSGRRKGDWENNDHRRRKDHRNDKREDNGEWEMVEGRRCRKQEQTWQVRDERLKNTVTFFISNIPDECSSNGLWKAFQHFGSIEDAFVPNKRDGAGNRSGFVRFSGVDDAGGWAYELSKVRIGNNIVGVNVARFNRDGSKAEPVKRYPSKYVPTSTSTMGGMPRVWIERKDWHGRTYANAVSGDGNPTSHQAKVINLPTMACPTAEVWGCRSLVGVAKDLEGLDRLKEVIEGEELQGALIRYMGGLTVLLTYESKEDAVFYLKECYETWGKLFDRLYLWDGSCTSVGRVAWIKVRGMPAALWDSTSFNCIGRECGRLLQPSGASTEDGDLSNETMAVLVESGETIRRMFTVKWDNSTWPVWVEEVDDSWTPSFIGRRLVGDDEVTPEKPCQTENEPPCRTENESPGSGWQNDVESPCMDSMHANKIGATSNVHGSNASVAVNVPNSSNVSVAVNVPNNEPGEPQANNVNNQSDGAGLHPFGMEKRDVDGLHGDENGHQESDCNHENHMIPNLNGGNMVDGNEDMYGSNALDDNGNGLGSDPFNLMPIIEESAKVKHRNNLGSTFSRKSRGPCRSLKLWPRLTGRKNRLPDLNVEFTPRGRNKKKGSRKNRPNRKVMVNDKIIMEGAVNSLTPEDALSDSIDTEEVSRYSCGDGDNSFNVTNTRDMIITPSMVEEEVESTIRLAELVGISLRGHESKVRRLVNEDLERRLQL